MRRGNTAAVVERVDDELVVYDIVLLAGSPRHVTLRLAPDLAPESQIEVEGEQWTVADVRSNVAPPQLICIYAD